jgi:PHD/YefM family antitoxin component YafN of YafNO toxin-antitoxin module
MANSSKNITLSEAAIKKRGGIVILPLAEYERMKENLEMMKEDLEMLRSKKLAKEIKKAREEAKKGKVISLEEVEKRLNL